MMAGSVVVGGRVEVCVVTVTSVTVDGLDRITEVVRVVVAGGMYVLVGGGMVASTIVVEVSVTVAGGAIFVAIVVKMLVVPGTLGTTVTTTVDVLTHPTS